jgi:hypothetical protein
MKRALPYETNLMLEIDAISQSEDCALEGSAASSGSGAAVAAAATAVTVRLLLCPRLPTAHDQVQRTTSQRRRCKACRGWWARDSLGCGTCLTQCRPLEDDGVQ